MMKALLPLCIAGALSTLGAIAHAEDCALPQVAADYSLQIPCIEVNNYRLAAQLQPAQPAEIGSTASAGNLYWKLTGAPDAITCGKTYENCVVVDSAMGLDIPVVLSGLEHNVHLNYVESANPFAFFWGLSDYSPATVTLKQAQPNSNGSFDQLWRFEGNFTRTGELQFALAHGVTAPVSQVSANDTRVLRIFHINDMHNELRSVSGSRGDTHRLSQMVKIINDAKSQAAENEIVLFVSAGDDHIGNPFDELMGESGASFQMSPAYRSYSAAGMDAAVVGNHELDRGSSLLARAIRSDAAFPVLSSNLYGSTVLSQNEIFPAVIGSAKGLRVGIIGLTTPEETLLRSKDDPRLDAAQLLNTLSNTLHFVEPYADVIIVLSHVGYNGQVDGNVRHELELGDVEVAQAIAASTSKPAVIVGGHTHTALNASGLDTVINGIPVVQTGGKGQHLGEMVMNLSFDGTSFSSQNTATLHSIKRRDDRVAADDSTYANYEHDSDLDQTFEKYVMQPLYSQLDSRLTEIIGRAADIPELSTAQTYADRYIGETVIGNFMNDAIVERSQYFPTGPDGSPQQLDLAVFNATGLNGGVEPGIEISFNDWYSVMPFADIITLTEMTGAQIKEMVLSNAKRIVRPEELVANGGTLDPSGYVSRGFLHFSKDLRYTIRLGASVEETSAENITIKGQPIDNVLDQNFRVAFGDYIANGGEGWRGEAVGNGLPDTVIGFNLKALSFHDTGLIYRNEVLEYIRSKGEVSSASGAVKDGRLNVVQ